MKVYDSQVKRVVNKLNFKNINKHMTNTGWNWGTEGVPTIDSLKETASYLLKNAILSCDINNPNIIMATGGFFVVARFAPPPFKQPQVDLLFYTDWSSE
jgi:hypothetical protein